MVRSLKEAFSPSVPRSVRIAEQIQRELAFLIRQEVRDPRVGLVTVTEVEVSRDLAHAKVFISSLEESDKLAESVKSLNGAGHYLRRLLGDHLKLRAVPGLQFVADVQTREAVRISALIHQAAASPSIPLEID